MKRITILIASVCCVGVVLGQTGNSKRALAPAEQADIIGKVRDHALSYTKQLPNYICTQRTLQVVSRSMNTIEEQISFVDNRETRRVVSINGHPVAAGSPDQLRGTPSRGEFGTILEVIFDPQTAATIQWQRQTTLNHRPVYVFAYRVPQSTGYVLTGSRRTILAPYHGFVYADAKTFGVVRIEMKILSADLPRDSEYVNVGLTLDYGPEQVAGQEFILPAHYDLHYQMRNGLAAYVANYTNYRKFSADATIEFEGDKNP